MSGHRDPACLILSPTPPVLPVAAATVLFGSRLLAVDNRIGRSTAYRYLYVGIDALTTTAAPRLLKGFLLVGCRDQAYRAVLPHSAAANIASISSAHDEAH